MSAIRQPDAPCADGASAAFYRPQRIRTVLVANRGEIAVRVIRAAHELGMRAVAVVSDADRDSLAARMADEAIHIGSSHAAKSYLNAAAILAAAQRCGADAIHPGYGFLSENAAFAAQVEAAGLIFVGPSSAVIATMGDKAKAPMCRRCPAATAWWPRSTKHARSPPRSATR
jgi:acetyl-CoA carboxylase biotin carboxylase subunit